jgi:hypothetical protein
MYCTVFPKAFVSKKKRKKPVNKTPHNPNSVLAYTFTCGSFPKQLIALLDAWKDKVFSSASSA